MGNDVHSLPGMLSHCFAASANAPRFSTKITMFIEISNLKMFYMVRMGNSRYVTSASPGIYPQTLLVFDR